MGEVMSKTSKSITAQDTWTNTITIGEDTCAYVGVGVSGTTSNGSKVRLRWYDPDTPTQIFYSDDVLATAGQTFQTAFVVGPAVVSAGCKTGEFGAGDSFTVTMRAGYYLR